jgi:hypothetical protein
LLIRIKLYMLLGSYIHEKCSRCLGLAVSYLPKEIGADGS